MANNQTPPQWTKAGESTASHPDFTKRAEVMIKVEPGYWMHVDADRDGNVDGDVHREAWMPGKGKRGAIVLVNCDADGDPPVPLKPGSMPPWRPRRMDNEDQEVNGPGDLEDMAPLVIRRTVDTVSKTWRGVLSIVAFDDRIRIFAKRVTTDVKGQRSTKYIQVLGKDVSASYTLPDLEFTEDQYFIEGTSYPDAQFDGKIVLKLTITENGAPIFGHETTVKVAPWVMFHHLNPTRTVFVAALSSARNARFVKELDQALAAGGVPPSVKFTEKANSDAWMQDVMEIGYSQLPGRVELPVVMPTALNRGNMLQHWPRNGLLLPGVGFVQPVLPGGGSTRDSFGNLECSPPVTVKGKEYKFGRIVYGRDLKRGVDMHPKVVEFFNAQRIQSPFAVDTGWLHVGHVDEAFSFCPMRASPKKFKVLIASPRVAVGLLDKLIADGHGQARFFSQVTPAEWTLAAPDLAGYTFKTPEDMKNDAAFVQVQNAVQAHLDAMKAVLQEELGLENDDFVELPVLFHQVGKNFLAYTPGVVNMLVSTRADGSAHLVIPKPLGPVINGKCFFEAEVDRCLEPFKASGITHTYLKDFVEYHLLQGEVHCGTNSHRQASHDVHWWEQVDLA